MYYINNIILFKFLQYTRIIHDDGIPKNDFKKFSHIHYI